MRLKVLSLTICMRKMKKKDGKVVIHLLGCGVDEYLILEKNKSTSSPGVDA